jgi:hypothetical protein
MPAKEISAMDEELMDVLECFRRHRFTVAMFLEVCIACDPHFAKISRGIFFKDHGMARVFQAMLDNSNYTSRKRQPTARNRILPPLLQCDHHPDWLGSSLGVGREGKGDWKTRSEIMMCNTRSDRTIALLLYFKGGIAAYYITRGVDVARVSTSYDTMF